MNTYFNILFKTNNTFDYLDNQFEDQLEVNSNFIFLLLGAIYGIDSFFKEYRYFDDLPVIIVAVGIILFGAGFGLVIGRYLVTYTLYGIGKLINGKSKLIDIRVVAAYSFVPNFLKLPIVLLLDFKSGIVSSGSITYWILTAFYIVIWLWTIKIMIQGVVNFQKIGIFKGILNISPFLIIGLLTFLFILR